MEHQYRLDIVRDHLIVRFDDETCALLDTGSPFSFGTSFNFAGSQITPQAMPEALSTQLQGWLGFPVQHLIGMDAMRSHVIEISWPDRTLVVDPEQAGATTHELGECLTIPTLEFQANGKPVRGFLDTGAHLSYAPAPVVEAEYCGIDTHDFHPLTEAAPFATPLAMLQFQLGEVWTARCGVLPPRLAALTSVLGGWIVGADLFRFRRVTLDFPRGRIGIEPVELVA